MSRKLIDIPEAEWEAPPKRGRPRKGLQRRRVVSMKLEPSLVEALDAHCKASGKSRGDVVTEWIQALETKSNP